MSLMSLFDQGDMQRLERESQLTSEAPRVLPEDDRSPVEEPVQSEPSAEPERSSMESDAELMLDTISLLLRRRTS
jgi:hypothetical protein